LNHSCKKLKLVEPTIKPRKSGILVRPQFSRHPIPRRRKGIRKFPRTSSPLDIDATGEVLLGSAVAGPVGALIGLGSATLRTFAHMGTATVETIRATAEKTRELKKKKPAEKTS